MVTTEFPGVTLIEPGDNLGFAAANNVALRALGFDGMEPKDEPEFVAFLNPDTEVRQDAMPRLANFLREHPKAGAVGAQLLYPDGSFQHSAFRFPGVVQTWLDLFPAHHRIMNSALNGRYRRAGMPFEVDHPLGACILARGEAIRQVGLFDQRYFMYVEEVDWCRRLKQAGWQVWCEPRAIVVHHEAQSTRQFRETMTVQLWRSRLQYFAKFEHGVRLRLLRSIIRFGATAAQAWARDDPRLGEEERAARMRAYAQVSALAGEGR